MSRTKPADVLIFMVVPNITEKIYKYICYYFFCILKQLAYIISSIFLFLNCNLCVAVEENRKIPPMFEMDDYRACKAEKGLYCKFTFKLFPDKADNLVWQIIQVRSIYIGLHKSKTI